MAALGGLTLPLALMMTLRANASLVRINEARLLWGGGVVLHAQTLSMLMRSYVLP